MTIRFSQQVGGAAIICQDVRKGVLSQCLPQLVTRLLLASQAGTLRLAVRSADEQLQKRYLDGETTLVALNEQTRSLIPLDKLASQVAPQPGVAAKPRPRAVATSPKIEIYRGVQSTWQAP